MTNKKETTYGKTKLFGAQSIVGQLPVIGDAEDISGVRNAEMFEMVRLLTNYETYQPGYSYAIKFDSDIKKLNLAFACVYNQIYNIYGAEGQTDAVSIILVDNNLEKFTVSHYLRNFADNYDFNYCENAQDLCFCANGVILITLDELPEVVKKLTALNNEREKALNSLQSFIQNLLDRTGGLDLSLDSLVDPEKQELLNLMQDAEVEPSLLSQESLYNVNEHVANILSYLADPDRFEYETQHFTIINENDTDDVDHPIVSYNYRSVPVGALFVYSGYIYNIPEYYQNRKYLLDFLKALIPSTFIWTEYRGQSNYIPLEDYSRYVIRNIYVGDNTINEAPFFFKRIPSNQFDRTSFEPLGELQDLQTFTPSNGIQTISKANNIRINQGKLFAKQKNLAPQLSVALALSQLNRNVLFVVKDAQATKDTIEEIIKQNEGFNGFARSVNIVSQDHVLHYVYTCDTTVIDEDVELSADLLAHLCNITNHIRNEEGEITASGMIMFNSSEAETQAKTKPKGKKAKAKDQDELDDAEMDDNDPAVRQYRAIVDYLRDRRIEQRVPYEYNEVDNVTAITDNCYQALEYFSHQEKRNWNSQLSGDKFLTVRCNNREISYYPNLSNNSFALAGFNNHYFDNLLTTSPDRAVWGAEYYSGEYQYGNLNLNSGDFITNISIAIHRIINTFTNRKQRVLSTENINVVWMVNSEQTDLLPLYEKLFSNIFQKEEGVNVNILYANKFFKSLPPNHDGIPIIGSLGSTAAEKRLYNSLLLFLQKFIPYYHENAENFVSPEHLINFDMNDSVDEQVVKLAQFMVSKEHREFYNYALNQEPNKEISEGIAILQGLPKKLSMAGQDQGQSNIFLCTTDEYFKLGFEVICPDIIVFENMFDLYRSETSAQLANMITKLLSYKLPGRSVILVSSPENDAELLLDRCDTQLYDNSSIRPPFLRPSNLDIALNQSSAERFAYVVNFDLEDFGEPSFTQATLDKLKVEEICADYQAQAQNLPYASLNAFTMPLSAYRLPRQANNDYRVIEKAQLPAQKRYGYIPALGEKSLEVQLGYYNFTDDKIINSVLAILTASKNSKARGLLVVNKPELKEIFAQFAKHLNFQIHDFDTIQLERAVFSHAVILATPLDYLEQAVIQHVCLLTRGFKTIGSVFLLCHAPYNQELFGVLASNDPTIRKNRLIELTGSEILTRPYPVDYLASNQISPYFYFSRKTSQGYYFQKELPGFKAYQGLPKDQYHKDLFGKMDPQYIRSLYQLNYDDSSELDIFFAKPLSFNTPAKSGKASKKRKRR